MITNRNIETVALFEDALDEVIESARESGVDDDELAAAIRARAARLDSVDEGDEADEGDETDTVDGTDAVDETDAVDGTDES
ncbi:hypothetical protein [Halogranum gelatinilyticum]|nr:hypothetical protein [Halogranum gelatinilyticum]